MTDDAPSRRRFLSRLGAAGTAGLAGLAGCSGLVPGGSPAPDDPPAPGVDDPPDPDRHVFGADGEWSSFGCNAANTREVHDGRAPVDGVEVRWRIPASGVNIYEPVVAGGRVYLRGGDGLDVFGADQGEFAWSLDAHNVGAPLVRDGTAYVAADGALRALDAASGEARWTREFDADLVTSPGGYPGRELLVAADETVYAVAPDTGEVRWSRRLFGRVRGPPAMLMGHWAVFTTAASEVVALGPDGTGARRWRLPALVVGTATADTDHVYVNCQNGRTYALSMEMERADVVWSADTGIAERGIAVAQGRVFVANGRELVAVGSDAGEVAWRTEMGDWRHTAPALGRDTLFVGGDRLRALDPTPSGVGDGPATRFEWSTDGQRVGPGPVLDDGVVYVVADEGGGGSGDRYLYALE